MMASLCLLDGLSDLSRLNLRLNRQSDQYSKHTNDNNLRNMVNFQILKAGIKTHGQSRGNTVAKNEVEILSRLK